MDHPERENLGVFKGKSRSLHKGTESSEKRVPSSPQGGCPFVVSEFPRVREGGGEDGSVGREENGAQWRQRPSTQKERKRTESPPREKKQ